MKKFELISVIWQISYFELLPVKININEGKSHKKWVRILVQSNLSVVLKNYIFFILRVDPI